MQQVKSPLCRGFLEIWIFPNVVASSSLETHGFVSGEYPAFLHGKTGVFPTPFSHHSGQKDYKKLPEGSFFLYYLFDHCGDFLAFLSPNFFLSTCLGSRLSILAFFNTPLNSPSCNTRARDIPWRTASACA